MSMDYEKLKRRAEDAFGLIDDLNSRDDDEQTLLSILTLIDSHAAMSRPVPSGEYRVDIRNGYVTIEEKVESGWQPTQICDMEIEGDPSVGIPHGDPNFYYQIVYALNNANFLDKQMAELKVERTEIKRNIRELVKLGAYLTKYRDQDISGSNNDTPVCDRVIAVTKLLESRLTTAEQEVERLTPIVRHCLVVPIEKRHPDNYPSNGDYLDALEEWRDRLIVMCQGLSPTPEKGEE